LMDQTLLMFLLTLILTAPVAALYALELRRLRRFRTVSWSTRLSLDEVYARLREWTKSIRRFDLSLKRESPELLKVKVSRRLYKPIMLSLFLLGYVLAIMPELLLLQAMLSPMSPPPIRLEHAFFIRPFAFPAIGLGILTMVKMGPRVIEISLTEVGEGLNVVTVKAPVSLDLDLDEIIRVLGGS